MRGKIEKVLREKVAPALAQHGGGVEFVDFKDGCLT
ncbi:MAG: NifU family protein, partial [Oscillospiraceae bacterium]|nr:NifU family protein [Oscillospiraceae bacterium]